METTQTHEDLRKGLDLLKDYCAIGFRSDINAAALSLGFEPDEIRAMLDGEKPIDEDTEMKMRAIARERNFCI